MDDEQYEPREEPSTDMERLVEVWNLPESPEKMPATSRTDTAFELRRAGATWKDVADTLKYKSPESARQAVLGRVKSYYKANESLIEETMMLELERLDHLQLVCWMQAKEGNLAAVDRILKIMDHRAKLLGMAHREASAGVSMTENNVTVVVGGSEQEYIESLKQIRAMAVRSISGGEGTE